VPRTPLGELTALSRPPSCTGGGQDKGKGWEGREDRNGGKGAGKCRGDEGRKGGREENGGNGGGEGMGPHFLSQLYAHTNWCRHASSRGTVRVPVRAPQLAMPMVSGTHKFDRGLSRLLHAELHWLDVTERVVYKLGDMMFNCQQGQAPPYLVALCEPVEGVASRQHLRSATRQLLVALRHRLSSCD